jgi:hypothetical protein
MSTSTVILGIVLCIFPHYFPLLTMVSIQSIGIYRMAQGSLLFESMNDPSFRFNIHGQLREVIVPQSSLALLD